MFLIVQCHQDEDDVKFLQKILQNFIYEISKNLNHIFIDVIKTCTTLVSGWGTKNLNNVTSTT